MHSRLNALKTLSTELSAIKPDDKVGQRKLESDRTWFGDLIRQLEVTPTLGNENTKQLVSKMLEQARAAESFITSLRPHLGISAPAAVGMVIDTSKWYLADVCDSV
jgi:hypothetical protein